MKLTTVENGYMHNGYMHKTDICTYFKSPELFNCILPFSKNGYMHNGYIHKTVICTYFKSLESTKSPKKKRIYAHFLAAWPMSIYSFSTVLFLDNWSINCLKLYTLYVMQCRQYV
jgi:hypothetical protein